MDTATKKKPAVPEALVNGLNEDLRREFQAIVRYTQFAASVEGPHRPQIAELFRGEIEDELRHAHFLADKIAALGGEPTTLVPPVETSRDAREMIEMVAAAEREDVEAYSQRARGRTGWGHRFEGPAREHGARRDAAPRGAPEDPRRLAVRGAARA